MPSSPTLEEEWQRIKTEVFIHGGSDFEELRAAFMMGVVAALGRFEKSIPKHLLVNEPLALYVLEGLTHECEVFFAEEIEDF